MRTGKKGAKSFETDEDLTARSLPDEAITRLLGPEIRFIDVYWEDLKEETRARHGVFSEFELSPPPHITLTKPRRKRGWHAKFAKYSGNEFWGDDIQELAVAKAACNRLTPESRKLGAKANAEKAAAIRSQLLAVHKDELQALGNRGNSKLAKELAPKFGLGVSTMRRHIEAVKKLLTSR